ncbi:MAG: carbohydrate ABC transporter permease [Bacillota bacterium]
MSLGKPLRTGGKVASRPNESARKEARFAWILLTPALIAFMVVAFVPILRTIWLSLHDYRLNRPGQETFVGLRNYIDLFTNPEGHLLNGLWATVRFTVASVGIELVLGIAIALLLHRAFWGRGAVRASVLIPWAIPTAISGLMWKFMFDDRLGLFNALLLRVGLIDSYQAWLGDPTTAWMAIVAADVWKMTPFVALLLLAGLQVIPADIYEAARVDGASAWTTFRRITLPLLKPSILVVLVFRTMDSFRAFDIIFVMTGGASGTETAAVYAYKTMMRYLDFGNGSAISIILFICVLAINFFYVKILGANLGKEA